MRIRRKPDLAEKRVEAHIIRNLRLLGCFVSKFSQPRNTMQTLGVPDLFVAHSGWHLAFWCEVKAPGKEANLSTAQAVWHREARAAGQVVIVASSTDHVLEHLRASGVRLT